MRPEELRDWLGRRGFEPTVSQLAAIAGLDQPLVVSAGAGAGKTRVLVERYLHIIRSGRATVEQIVAITFTRKAAAEMRARVHREMVRLAGLPGEDRSLWEAAMRDLPAAPITTIHGFCAGLLREYPVEADVDPRFVLEEEFDAREAVRRVIDDLVMKALAADEPGIGLLLRLYGKDRLVTSLAAVRAQARSRGLTGPDVLAASEQARAERLARLPALAEAIAESVAGLVTGLHGMKRPDRAQALQAAWEAAATDVRWLVDAAQSLALPETPEEVLERLARVEAPGSHVDKRSPRLREQVEEFKDELLPEFAETVLDAAAAPALAAAGGLLTEADAVLAARRETTGLLDFEDLQLIVRDLLRTQPRLAAELRERYPFVMVDEFQDTNTLQSELLERWRPANLFLVGDPQQSIYRFRGAEVEVFESWRDGVAERGGEAIVLADNFRTQAPLVAFQDYVFAQLAPGHEPGMAWRRAAGIDAHVELLLAGDPDESAGEAREREAEQLALRLRMLLVERELVVFERVPDEPLEQPRPARPGDIAILLRALTDAPLYEAALRRHGIPVRIVSGSGFYERQEVIDCLNVLHALDNPADAIGLAAALRSPFFGLSDDTLLWLRRGPGQPPELWEAVQAAGAAAEAGPLARAAAEAGFVPSPEQLALVARAARLLRRWHRLARRLAPAALLAEALAASDYELVLRSQPGGDLAVANVQKLVSVAAEFAAARPRTLGEFLRYVREFTEGGGREAAAEPAGAGGDAVQIMTVHQSKGLEFPVVVLADTARPLQHASQDGILLDRELGLGLYAPDLGGERVETGVRRAIRERHRQEEIAEAVRVLYVAVTRARDLLIIAGTRGRINTSRPFAEMSSWLEWICRTVGLTDLDETPDWLDLPCGRVRIVRDLAADAAGLRAGGQAAGLRAEGQARVGLGAEGASGPNGAEDSSGLAGVAPDGGSAAETAAALWEAAFAPVSVAGRGPGQAASPGDVSPSAASLAVTSLLQYQACPRQYALERRWGLPAAQAAQAGRIPLGDGETGDGGGGAEGAGPEGAGPAGAAADTGIDPLLRGRLVHRVCQWLTDPDEIEPLLRRAAREAGATLTSADLSSMERLLRRYTRSETFRTVQRHGGLAEHPFRCRIGGHMFSGIMDRIVRMPDGSLRIIDFKTNRIDAGQVAAAAEQYRWQAVLYSVAAQRLFGGPLDSVQLHFLEPDRVHRFVFGPDELAASEREIAAVAGVLDRGRTLADYRPRTGEHCFRCAYEAVCRRMGVPVGVEADEAGARASASAKNSPRLTGRQGL